MSFNDEYSSKVSQWSPRQTDEDEDDGNAPTQPMRRVRVTAQPVPARPQQAPRKEQIAWPAPTPVYPIPTQHSQEQRLSSLVQTHNSVPANSRMPLPAPSREGNRISDTNPSVRVPLVPTSPPAKSPQPVLSVLPVIPVIPVIPVSPTAP